MKKNTIRLMDIADYKELFQLWTSTTGMGLRSLDDSKEGISLFLKRNPSTNFVALNSGIIVGAILCGNDGRRGYIYHTVVQEAYHNQGIATALIEASISALKKEGITRVCLNVMESNEKGKAFWQNRGWEKKDFLGFYSKSITEKENTPLFTLD
ncbi:MAG: GNAT family N-acetyltransferase [Lachnospiraceae bacterium]|nr:GNAT family N-acetyltransferase [Lachnospiraceae bacterium]